MESAATKESEVHVAMPWNRDSKTADLQGHQVGELPQRRCKVFARISAGSWKPRSATQRALKRMAPDAMRI